MNNTPKNRRARMLCGLLLSVPLLAQAVADEAPPAADAAPGAAEDNAAAANRALLESLVRSEASRQFPPLTKRQRFLIGPIASNVEIPHCNQPIRAMPPPAHHMPDRVTIEVRCNDTRLWHLYVPVRVLGTSTVAVATHALVLGAVLKQEDMRVEEHDLTELPPGFLDDPAIAVGLTAGRPIAGGAYLTNQLLVGAKAVERGQSVTLLADAGGMSIRMAGRAMSDGLINQRVKVQNLSSGKVVEGVARSNQVVEVILQ
jgi:flagella basal body P-ring formation protein FlgA